MNICFVGDSVSNSCATPSIIEPTVSFPCILRPFIVYLLAFTLD